MNWLTRAEARFGYLAIPGLPQIIVAFNLLVYVLALVKPEFVALLELSTPKVLHGEVWRLVTFIFIPGVVRPLSLVLYLMFLFFVGTGLERNMGPFRLTLYYLFGIVGLAIAGLFSDGGWGNSLLNLSMLFAFARYEPDLTIYIMFILPVRLKWMAWFMAALLLFNFVTADWSFKLATVVAFSNYLLFFGPELVRDARHRQQVSGRRARFQREIRPAMEAPLHECAVCHRTDTTPELEFRVARDGEEYCLDHLPKASPGG